MIYDLISDYKKIINESASKTILSLEEIFKDINIDKNKEFVHQITKFFMAMEIWSRKITEKNSDTNLEKLMKNILLNYCSILNCLILGDEKVIKFLYRNIIESILRAITLNFNTKDIEGLFKNISNSCTTVKEKELIQTYLSVLKSIYDDTCLYVHTDVSKIPHNLNNLVKYNINSKTLKVDKLLNDFNNLNICMLCILLIKYYDLYTSFKSNARGFIDEIIPLSKRVQISHFIEEKRSDDISVNK